MALVCATAFWMPAGQTWSFANSDPLNDEDREDLLLPFPQVFMAFAEPIEIGPTLEPNTEQSAILKDFDAAVASMRSKNPSLSDLLFSTPAVENFGAMSVADVLELRGGRIEGVLLIGDSLGRLEDTFAWCIALPSGLAGTLGRHVIPARLSMTMHRSLVENLVAVAAWADWHEPDGATAMPVGLGSNDLKDLTNSQSFRRDADQSGGGGVRVLNVRSSIKTSDTAQDTGRHVAPHVRRGHWRRQRFGPRREQVRRIRIAPLVVNAHRGSTGHRVYVIPSPR